MVCIIGTQVGVPCLTFCTRQGWPVFKASEHYKEKAAK